MTTHIKHIRRGFTLVEIMIVLLIIGAIMFLGTRLINQAMGAMKSTKAQATLQDLRLGIDRYKADTEQLPQKLNDLIKKPSSPETVSRKWRGPYFGKKGIDEIPVDPWDNEYKYKVTKGGKHPYDLYSEGPDGEQKIDIWDL